MKSICTFMRFAEIVMHVEQARSRMLIGSMAGHARLPSTCPPVRENWGPAALNLRIGLCPGHLVVYAEPRSC